MTRCIALRSEGSFYEFQPCAKSFYLPHVSSLDVVCHGEIYSWGLSTVERFSFMIHFEIKHSHDTNNNSTNNVISNLLLSVHLFCDTEGGQRQLSSFDLWAILCQPLTCELKVLLGSHAWLSLVWLQA